MATTSKTPKTTKRLKKATPPGTENAIDPPAIYYDGRRFYHDTGTDYVPMSSDAVKEHLMCEHGLSHEEARKVMCRLRIEGYVHVYSNLAGHPRGLHEIGGKRWLVPDSPPLVEAKRGRWPTIKRTLERFCGVGVDDYGRTQYDFLLGHLKTQLGARRKGVHRPGPAVWLAGPPDAGKSTVVDLIVGGLLGRIGDAHSYLSGESRFAGDLIGAEVWVLDDKEGAPRIELRRKIGDRCKSVSYGPTIKLEAKFCEGLHARPAVSIFGCCNLEPDALRALPPLERDLVNKNAFLLCHSAGIPGGDEFDGWVAKMKSELPAFANYLEHEFEIPEELHDPRCGVPAIQHPEILSIIHEQSPEAQLVGLIVEVLPRTILRSEEEEKAGVWRWEGISAGLLADLGGSGRGGILQGICGGSAIRMGSLLSSIENDRGFPVRVSSRTLRGLKRWKIEGDSEAA